MVSITLNADDIRILKCAIGGLPTPLNDKLDEARRIEFKLEKLMPRKHELLVKRYETILSVAEQEELNRLEEEIESLVGCDVCPHDPLGQAYQSAMHAIYKESLNKKLTPEEIEERNKTSKKVLEEVLRAKKDEDLDWRKIFFIAAEGCGVTMISPATDKHAAEIAQNVVKIYDNQKYHY